MTRARAAVALAGAGSALLLAAAFAFQHLGGLAPCALCLWQRWPHAAGIALACLAVMIPLKGVWSALGALALALGAGLGLYHTGVERSWWDGPAACAAGGEDLGALDGAALLDFDADVAVVLCDTVAWSMAGLSMASWNALASLTLAGLWVLALRRQAVGSTTP